MTGPQTHPTPKSQLLPRDHLASRVRPPHVHTQQQTLPAFWSPGWARSSTTTLVAEVGGFRGLQSESAHFPRPGWIPTRHQLGGCPFPQRESNSLLCFALSVVLLDDMMLQLSEARRQPGKRSEAQAYLPDLLSSKLPLRGCTLRPSPGTQVHSPSKGTLTPLGVLPALAGASLPSGHSRRDLPQGRLQQTCLPQPGHWAWSVCGPLGRF